MALMSAKLYDALLDAGASEAKARHAAEAAAGGDTRFVALEGRMVALESRMTMMMWMVGKYHADALWLQRDAGPALETRDALKEDAA